MENYRLCDSEYRFMQVVWDAAPVGSGQLVELCEKGLLKSENSTVTVLAPRETVTAEAAGEFVDRTFGGSLPGFLAAFMSGRRLTAAEAEELTRLIEAHRED